MELDPVQHIEGVMLLAPQLYDAPELAILRDHLSRGDVFLDVGAYVGFYAVALAAHLGSGGRVYAIEAEPENFERLRRNVALQPSSSARITPVNAAISDSPEVLRLGLNLTGNKGGCSFVRRGEAGIMLHCTTLADVCCWHGISRIDAMKLDLEGFETKALRGLFENSDLRPPLILFEAHADQPHLGGDAAALLRAEGYSVERVSASNCLARSLGENGSRIL